MKNLLTTFIILIILMSLISTNITIVDSLNNNRDYYAKIYFFEFVRNTTHILVQKALKLWQEHGNKSYLIFPVYNQLKNRVKSPFDTRTLAFFIYAFMSTGNYAYLKYALRTANDIIKLNLTTNPAYFAWLFQFNRSYMAYAKRLINNIIKDITPSGLPGYNNKTYRLPWDVCSSTLAPLIKMYEYTQNKTYLDTATNVIFSIFKYLANNKTMLLNDGYRINNSKIEIVDNFQRVYSAGLLISNMLYLYLLSKNQTLLMLLKNYVKTIIKYFWMGNHWAYRVYSSGKIMYNYLETNFYKLDYALFLFYHYIERNSAILKIIKQSVNYALQKTRYGLFKHASFTSDGLIYAQLGSFVYLLKFLNLEDAITNRTYSVVNSFLKRYGFVQAVYLEDNIYGYPPYKHFDISEYGPCITFYSTAYMYSSLYLIANTTWMPFPLTYDPNVDLPLYPYFGYPSNSILIQKGQLIIINW
ncbi:MAG: glycoside hydrolase family 76 protein [Candidatus Asgardarchaeum sp.]